MCSFMHNRFSDANFSPMNYNNFHLKFWSKINVVKTLCQLANIYHLIITLLRKRQFLWTRYFVYILANPDFMVCLCTKLNFSKVKWLVFNVRKRKAIICSYTFCYKTNYWYWHNMQNFLFSLKYDKYHNFEFISNRNEVEELK